MAGRAPWQTQLHEALTLLALPADEQIRTAGSGCVACELMQSFEQAYTPAIEEAMVFADQRQVLDTIAGVLRTMEKPDFECNNNDVLRRPVWERLRELAANALRLFGWEKIAIEPFREDSPGVWFRAPSAGQPSDLPVHEAAKPRVPRWVILGGCLSVFVCLALCGVAVGVWVYAFKHTDTYGNPTNSAAPALPPGMGPPEAVVVNGRLVEAEGGFSYVPPEGWLAYDRPPLKYRFVTASMKEENSPNIHAGLADDEFADRPLKDFVDLNLVVLRTHYMPKFHFVKREDFQTTEGLLGVRVIIEVEPFGEKLRQTYYFFSQGNKKYFATCTAKSEEGEKLDPVFEASMKTFRLEQ